MRRYRVIVSNLAAQSITDIENYVSTTLSNPIAAKNLRRKIDAEIAGLCFVPARSHLQDNYYKIKVGRYKIIYSISHDVVSVIDVVYTGRNYALGI